MDDFGDKLDIMVVVFAHKVFVVRPVRIIHFVKDLGCKIWGYIPLVGCHWSCCLASARCLGLFDDSSICLRHGYLVPYSYRDCPMLTPRHFLKRARNTTSFSTSFDWSNSFMKMLWNGTIIWWCIRLVFSRKALIII